MDRHPRPPVEDPARGVVQFTRTASRRHNRAQSSIRDLLIDLYSNVLAVACGIAMALSVVVTFRDAAPGPGERNDLADPRWQVVSVDVLWAVLLTSAFVGLVSVLRRTGPVALGRAEAAWWLQLPVDRHPLVSRPFLERVGLAAVLGSVVGAFLSFVTDGDRAMVGHILAGTTIGASVALLVLGSAAAQLAAAERLGDGARRPPETGSSAGAAPFIAVWCGAFATAVAASALALILAAPIGLLLAIVVTVLVGVVVLPRIGRIGGRDLTRSGAVAGHALASVYALDANELRRAFAGDLRPARQGVAARFYRRPVRRPFVALMRADVVAFLRLMPSPAGALAWLALCVVVVLAPAVPTPAQLLMLVVAGCAVSGSVGVVARRVALLPSLGALLPLPSFLVRLSGALMPCLAMALWAGLLTACLVVVGAGDPMLILMGTAAGIGMGAGGIRGATRPPTDWTRPPVETPFGPIPRDQISSLLRGTDVTVVAMVPLVLALHLGGTWPLLVVVQLAVSAIGLTVATASGPAREP